MIYVKEVLKKYTQIANKFNTREVNFVDIESRLGEEGSILKTVSTFDFHSFDKILRERKRSQFKTEEEYQTYKKEILSSTQNGTCDLPTICVHNDKYWKVIDGMIRLLAYKVLGINPVVEFYPK